MPINSSISNRDERKREKMYVNIKNKFLKIKKYFIYIFFLKYTSKTVDLRLNCCYSRMVLSMISLVARGRWHETGV